MKRFAFILAAFLLSATFAPAVSAPAFATEKRMSGTIPVSAATRAARAEAAAKKAAQEKADAEATRKAAEAAARKTGQQKTAAPASAPAAVAAPQSQPGPQPAAARSVPPQAEATPAIARRGGPVNYVGEIETYKARADDTLLTIGEREGLGYVELRSANPNMDPWQPGAGTFMILPKMHLLPDSPRKGIVVNLSEMRLYHYRDDGSIKTHPIGIGREGFSTPTGTTTVTRKAIGPTWRPTDRMRREDPTLKPVYTAGPDNPLGSHALYLGWPQYLLHGTNKPWGIGRRVSSGCVRMYNDAIEELHRTVPTGTPVAVVRQPVKFGWVGEMLYIEAHPDGALADQVERVGGAPLDYKVPADIFANLSRAAGNARDNIDWMAVREALRDRHGYPVPILNGAGEEHRFVTASMVERAGTSRFGRRLTQEPQGPLVPVAAGQQVQPAPAVEASNAPNTLRRRQNSFN